MNRVEQVFVGLQIARKYITADICAEHDQIFLHFGPPSDEDRKLLEAANWHQEDDESWTHYV